MFCTECGNKIQYSYSKPKFCSSCGNKCDGSSFGRENKAPIEKEHQELSEDETDVDELPIIESFQVETESNGNNVFSFENLIGEASKNNQRRNKGSKNLEDFINDKRQ
jgi:hypothetical protein